LKRILHSGIVQRALPRLAAGYLKSARLGLRMVRDDSPKAEAIIASGRPVIACFWHNRLLSITLCWRGQGIDMLISRSRDGRLIAETAKYFGHGYIEGSTAKGTRDRRSMAAAREVVERLENGRFVGMTPDGPRGPRQRASPGVVRLAQIAGVDIVPVAASISGAWRANSWDRMIVPYPMPGSRGALLFGDPISIPADADGEALKVLRLTLEDRLNELSAEADRLVGAPVIEPAEPVMA
jgi:lysophospholipid acyltransferase (LPLAT)-like uncharacterized protein